MNKQTDIELTRKWQNILLHATSTLDKYFSVETGFSDSTATFPGKDGYPLTTYIIEPNEYSSTLVLDDVARVEDEQNAASVMQAGEHALIDLADTAVTEFIHAAATSLAGDVVTRKDGETTRRPYSGATIRVDFTETGVDEDCNITIDKIRAALYLLHRDNAPSHLGAATGDSFVFVCTKSQIKALLQQPEIQQADGINLRSILCGKPGTFMGCEVLCVNELPTDENGDRVCLLYARSRAKFALWQRECCVTTEQTGTSGAELTKANLTAHARYGATRLSDSGFVRIICSELREDTAEFYPAEQQNG